MSSAVARPIPRADPVTIAALPSRSPISSLSLLVKVGAEATRPGQSWPAGQFGTKNLPRCPAERGEWRGGRRLQHLPVVAARDVQPDPAGGGDDHDAVAGAAQAGHRLPA